MLKFYRGALSDFYPDGKDAIVSGKGRIKSLNETLQSYESNFSQFTYLRIELSTGKVRWARMLSMKKADDIETFSITTQISAKEDLWAIVNEYADYFILRLDPNGNLQQIIKMDDKVSQHLGTPKNLIIMDDYILLTVEFS